MCIHYEVWLFSITENLNVVYLRRKKSKVLVAQLCPIPCDPMAPTDHQAPLSMNSPGKNTGVGSHSLLQGIFPDPGIEPRPSALQAFFTVSTFPVFTRTLVILD